MIDLCVGCVVLAVGKVPAMWLYAQRPDGKRVELRGVDDLLAAIERGDPMRTPDYWPRGGRAVVTFDGARWCEHCIPRRAYMRA